MTQKNKHPPISSLFVAMTLLYVVFFCPQDLRTEETPEFSPKKSYTTVYGPRKVILPAGNRLSLVADIPNRMSLPYLLRIYQPDSKDTFQVSVAVDGKKIVKTGEFIAATKRGFVEIPIRSLARDTAVITLQNESSELLDTIVEVVRSNAQIYLEVTSPSQYPDFPAGFHQNSDFLAMKLIFQNEVSIEDTHAFIILENPNQEVGNSCLSWDSGFTSPDIATICREPDETVLAFRRSPRSTDLNIVSSGLQSLGAQAYYPTFKGGQGAIPALVVFADNGLASILGGVPNLGSFFDNSGLDMPAIGGKLSLQISGFLSDRRQRRASILSPYVTLDLCVGAWEEMVRPNEICREGWSSTFSLKSNRYICCEETDLAIYKDHEVTPVTRKKARIPGRILLHAFVINLPPNSTEEVSMIMDMDSDGRVELDEAMSQFDLLSNPVTLQLPIRYVDWNGIIRVFSLDYWFIVEDVDGNGEAGSIPISDPAPPGRLFPRRPPRG